MSPAAEDRSAAVEFRFSGRSLTGSAVRYGERAHDRAERFEPGAFVSMRDPVELNLQHDLDTVVADTRTGLEVKDGPSELAVATELRAGSAALSLVQRRALRGFSVGFVALEEHREAGERVITRAHLDHVALVDVPSYPGSRVELRQMSEAWLRATIPTGSSMACECSGPSCDSVLFASDAFVLDDGGDVLAFGGGGAQNILGSLSRGTLIVEDAEDGLRVGLTERGTDTARRIAEDARAAPMYVRPILDLDQSDYIEADKLRTFTRASVRAFVVKPTSASRGHRPAVIDGVESRRRLWL